MITEVIITSIEYLFTGLILISIGEKIVHHPFSSDETNKKKSIKVVTLVAVAVASTYTLEKVVK